MSERNLEQVPNAFGFDANTEGLEVASRLKEYITGKTSAIVLITGVAQGSLGGEAAISIASASPSLLILSARAEDRVEPIASKIASAYPSVDVRFLPMDLGNLESVHSAAAKVESWTDVTIDVLINNAGVMAGPYRTTEDGFEMQFGVGHLGHFLFTNLLLKADKIRTGGRIVNVSSEGHMLGPVRFDDPGFEHGTQYNEWQGYGQAKTANMLFSLALAERLKDRKIYSFSLHPGVIMTNLGRHMSEQELEELVQSAGERFGDALKTLQQGVSTHLVAAFDPSIVDSNGGYLSDCKITFPVKDYATDPEGAKKLWTLSEEMVGQKFTV
ncbi:MAG: hypothetical protein M1819_007289 [Sarea resinae]|nr:MAG: hypothetical protein M1819_007289 [Sarea resinae]